MVSGMRAVDRRYPSGVGAQSVGSLGGPAFSRKPEYSGGEKIGSTLTFSGSTSVDSRIGAVGGVPSTSTTAYPAPTTFGLPSALGAAAHQQVEPVCGRQRCAQRVPAGGVPGSPSTIRGCRRSRLGQRGIGAGHRRVPPAPWLDGAYRVGHRYRGSLRRAAHGGGDEPVGGETLGPRCHRHRVVGQVFAGHPGRVELAGFAEVAARGVGRADGGGGDDAGDHQRRAGAEDRRSRAAADDPWTVVGLGGVPDPEPLQQSMCAGSRASGCPQHTFRIRYPVDRDAHQPGDQWLGAAQLRGDKPPARSARPGWSRAG